MPEIILDNEQVVFDGPTPATVGELLSLLEHALGEAGRVLSAVTVDGEGFDDGLISRRLDELGRIQIESATIMEAVAKLAGPTAKALEEIRETGDKLANEVLRVAWDEAGRGCVDLGQRLGTVIQDVSHIAAHLGTGTELGVTVESLLANVDRWIDSVKAADAAEVCLRLDQGVLPGIAKAAAQLRKVAGQSEP